MAEPCECRFSLLPNPLPDPECAFHASLRTALDRATTSLAEMTAEAARVQGELDQCSHAATEVVERENAELRKALESADPLMACIWPMLRVWGEQSHKLKMENRQITSDNDALRGQVAALRERLQVTHEFVNSDWLDNPGAPDQLSALLWIYDANGRALTDTASAALSHDAAIAAQAREEEREELRADVRQIIERAPSGLGWNQGWRAACGQVEAAIRARTNREDGVLRK